MDTMEKLLQIRLEHLKTIPLNEIRDTIFSLYKCEQCNKETAEPTILMDNIHGIMNDFPLLTKTLLEEPSKFLKDLNDKKCEECKGKLQLQRLTYCRTNSQRGFDTHFRINHQTTGEESSVELAILTKEGEYRLIDVNTRRRLLGM